MIIGDIPRFVQDLDGERENEIRKARGETVERDNTHLKKV